MDIVAEQLIKQKLALYGSRKRLIALLTGVVKFLFTSISAFALICILSLIYDNPVYYSILKIAFLLTVAGSLYIFVIFNLRQRNHLHDVAGDFDRFSNGVGEIVLSASELITQRDYDSKIGVSTDLVGAQLEKAAALVADIPLGLVVPVKNIKRSALSILAAAALASAVFIFVNPGFKRFILSYGLFPSGIATILELADISITYRYPEYTGLTPETVSGGTGDITALKGTQVDFQATLLRKVNSPAIEFDSGLAISLDENDDRVKGTFTVLSNTSFYVTGERGVKSRRFVVSVREDKTPTVKILSPSTEEPVDVEGIDRLELSYSAADDYGLSEIYLAVYDENGESKELLDEFESEPENLKDKHKIDLGLIKNSTSDTVEIALMFYDNDRVSGPKFGVSDTLTLMINDKRGKHNLVAERLELLFEELIDILGDDIELKPIKKLLRSEPDVIKADQTVITRKINDSAESLEQILILMKDDEYSDITKYTGLLNIQIRMENLVEERSFIVPRLQYSYFARYDGFLAGEINDFEEFILFLDTLIKGERFRNSIQKGDEIADKFDELMDMLKNLGKDSGDMDRKELYDKLRQLQELMAQLAQQMAALSAQIPEGYINPDAFENITLDGGMEEIMKMIEEGRIDEALAKLESMQSGLENMMASMKSGFQSFASNSMSEGLRQADELISRIEKLEDAESDLNKDTEDLKSSALAGASKGDELRESMETLGARQDDIESKTEELIDDYDELMKGGLPMPVEIAQHLKDGDRSMEGASDDLRNSQLSMGISNQKEAVESLRKAREEAQNLIERLRMSARGSGMPVPFVMGRMNRNVGMMGEMTGDVNIPKASEPVYGKQLKERIVEALEGGSPEGFEDLNKKYYESLVK